MILRRLPLLALLLTSATASGFGQGVSRQGIFVASAATLDAALEGRITTTPLTPGTSTFDQSIGILNVRLEAQAPQIPRIDDQRPDFPPSYNLHVSLSQTEGTESFSGDDFRVLRGFDLKGVLGELYGLNRIRIEIPVSLEDGRRYDFSMVLPDRENAKQITERFEQGIRDYFHLTATRENRLMEVYVVASTPDRKPPAASAKSDQAGESFSSFVGFLPDVPVDPRTNRPPAATVFSLDAVNSITVQGTADQFCQTLETSLDFPVVNETNLQGKFAFFIEANQTSKNDFLDRLQDQLGLFIAPAQRNVEMLVFKPR